MKRTKILIASLDAEKFRAIAQSDARCYLKSYPDVAEVTIERPEKLLELNQSAPDILHLFCDVTSSATIGSQADGGLSVDRFLNKLVESNVKMLWVASENPGQLYIQAFSAARNKRLHLVLTMNRKNGRFEGFLCGLLAGMASGLSVPQAWAALAPQNGSDPRNISAPECIFLANRGQIVFH